MSLTHNRIAWRIAVVLAVVAAVVFLGWPGLVTWFIAIALVLPLLGLIVARFAAGRDLT
jgi:hypothetical protein